MKAVLVNKQVKIFSKTSVRYLSAGQITVLNTQDAEKLIKEGFAVEAEMPEQKVVVKSRARSGVNKEEGDKK
jgi:hypothetical protein